MESQREKWEVKRLQRSEAGEQWVEEGIRTPPGPKQPGWAHRTSTYPFPTPRHPAAILPALGGRVPAVHHSGPGPGGPVDVVPDSSHKLDQGLGALRDTVVWPYRVVEVADESVCIQLFLLEEQRGKKGNGSGQTFKPDNRAQAGIPRSQTTGEETSRNRIHRCSSSSYTVLVVKNPPANAGDRRDVGSIPGSGKAPGRRHGNPLQCSCLENTHGQRSLVGYSPWGHRVGHD